MSILRFKSVCYALLLSSVAASAEQVYRSVDDQGNVVYSDTPPAGVVETETVAIDPGPTPEQVEAARQDTRRIQESADAMASARRQREKERAEQQRLAEQRRHQAETDARLARLEEQQRINDYREWGAYYYTRPSRPIWREPPEGPDYPVVTPLRGIPSAGGDRGASHATRGAKHSH